KFWTKNGAISVHILNAGLKSVASSSGLRWKRSANSSVSFSTTGPCAAHRHKAIPMDMQSPPFLSVVLPAFNESHRLPQTLQELLPYSRGFSPRQNVFGEDGGSREEPATIVEQEARRWTELILLRQPRNMGKGAAVRRGCLAASGELVLF